MPIMMTSDLAGATHDDYEHLAAALLAALKAADGFIAHAAGPIEGGYQVSELWESEEAHHAWFETHVIPSLPAGAPRPTVAIRPIASIVTRD
jgi:heme-degrading monooxygenase HmoA